MNLPYVDYRTLIEELRSRLADTACERPVEDIRVMNGIRCRMAGLLDIPPETPIREIIDQLADKWRRDGLI